jgi:23S rRNA (adenine2030-N6)-methyltransferase
MLSYRHGFHAGNFADVMKHIILIQLIDYLCKKEKGFCFIDTHAGAGSYALDGIHAATNKEFENGIDKLLSKADLPEAFTDYVNLVKDFQKLNQYCYPGSPLIAQHLLRKQDRLFLYELHSTEIKALTTAVGKDKRVKVFHADGLKDSFGLLPPIERRGLVLIDPSYEIKSDYEQVVETLKRMYKHFATGTYALWYPVVERNRINKLERDISVSGIKNIQLFELAQSADSREIGMTACGMMVINPPWTLYAQMQTVLPRLAEDLGVNGEGAYRLKVLVAEGA